MAVWANRYAAEGVLRDLEAGKNICVVDVRLHEALGFADAVETLGGAEAWDRIVRANGQERLEHRSGGVLHLATPRTQGRIRGKAVDAVLVLTFRALSDEGQRELLDMLRPFGDAGAELILPD